MVNKILGQHGLKVGDVEAGAEVRAEDQRFELPAARLFADEVRRPQAAEWIRCAFDHQPARQDILRERLIGWSEILFFVLAQDIKGADQPDPFAGLQRQVESAQPKVSDLVRVGQRRFDSLFVDLHAEDGKIWIQLSESRGAFEGGASVKAVAKVNKKRISEQAVGPGEDRRLVKQDEIIDPPQSVRSGLAAGG